MAVNAAFSAASGAALTIGAGYWSGQLGEPGTIPVAVIGTGLLAYAVELAWLSGRGVGRTIASVDAGWVIGTVVLLAAVGGSFTAVGILAASLAGVAVAGLGWGRWLAARDSSRSSTQATYSTVDS